MNHLNFCLKAPSWTLYDYTCSFILHCPIPSLPMFFPIQFFPILKLPRGEGTSETKLLPGRDLLLVPRERSSAVSSCQHRTTQCCSHQPWPKWNCRSPIACNGYRWKPTLSWCVTHGDLLMWAQIWARASGKFNLLVL